MGICRCHETEWPEQLYKQNIRHRKRLSSQVQKKGSFCKIRRRQWKVRMYQGFFLDEGILRWPCAPPTGRSHTANPSQRVCNFHLQNKHPEPGPRSDKDGRMHAYFIFANARLCVQSHPNQKVLTPVMHLEPPLAVTEKNCRCLDSPPQLRAWPLVMMMMMMTTYWSWDLRPSNWRQLQDDWILCALGVTLNPMGEATT